MNRPLRRFLRLGALHAAAAALMLTGCAGQEPTTAVDAAPTEQAQSRNPLARRAAAQRSAPDLLAAALPPPLGLDTVIFVPPGDEAANSSLADALASLPRRVPTPPQDAPVAAEARLEALRLYASGHARLGEGDAVGAASAFEAATRLDPASPQPWRELGEALFDQGKQMSGVAAYRAAADRGLKDPRILWILAREAAVSHRPDDSAAYLVEAWEATPARTDAALPYLIAADLADVLADRGRLRAAAEMNVAAAELPIPFTHPTRMRLELADLYRRQSEMWRSVGDLQLRLRNFDGAESAFARAAQHPTLEPDAVLARRVYAHLLAGRSAEACTLIISTLAEAPGAPTESQVALLRHLALTESASDLAEAVRSLAAARKETATPSVQSGFVRARAAIEPPDVARETLVQFLAEHPHDEAAARALISVFPVSDSAARAAAAAAGACVAPEVAETIATSLLAGGGPAQPWLDALAAAGDDGSALVSGYALGHIGRAPAGAELVAGRAWPNDLRGSFRAGEAEILARAGRASESLAIASSLTGQDARSTTAEVTALAAVQRFSDALSRLSASLGAPSPRDAERVADLAKGAALASLLGRHLEAESYGLRAVGADPRDARGYDVLFGLYAPGGPLGAPQKLSEVARSLREADPSSQLLRVLSASELMQRQLDPQAEPILLGIVNQDMSRWAGDLLIALWERGARTPNSPVTERALAWLKDRAERYPEVDWVRAGWARVLAASGDRQEAERLLTESLTSRPSGDIPATLEALVRSDPARSDEADAMTERRLNATPPTFDAGIEWAALEARRGRPDAALERLTRAFPSGVSLTNPQGAALLRSIAALIGRENPPAGDTWAVSIAGLFEFCADRAVRMPPSLHEARLALLASLTPPDVARVNRALTDAERDVPEAAPALYARTALALHARGATPLGLPLLREAARRTESPSTELLFELMRMTVAAGDEEDTRAFLALMTDADSIRALLTALRRENADPLPDSPVGLRGELAYLLGQFFSSEGRDDMSIAAYREGLRIDPAHAWMKNNLGYQLLEQGDDLGEATRLLEEAHAALPNETSIIDSLAWARYLAGILEDDRAADGTIRREGAVSMLKRAAESADGRDNNVILDHLGDALWISGDRDGATAAWRRAEAEADKQLADLKLDRRSSPELVARTERERDAARAKISAVEQGQEPALVQRPRGR